MKGPCLSSLALLAGLAVASPPAAALSPDAARHLLSRTSFGPTPEAVERLLPLTHERAVQALLETVRTEPSTPLPDWHATWPAPRERGQKLSEEEKKRRQRLRRRQAVELKSWWYGEMLETDSPITERMTLFWHGHFTSSIRKVKSPHLMLRQNLLLRRHALGNFRDLLREVARDPAMVVYLDNQSNRKGAPNENFAREVLELFTLGEGHYTEQDIKEAARAFTGWMVDRRVGEFTFNPNRHDYGAKTFMGRTGRFDGNDILDIVLEQPQVATHVTEKLWRELIDDSPEPHDVRRIADRFRGSGYDISTLVSDLLNTRSFRSATTRGGQIKSPVELLVGTARLFNLQLDDLRPLVAAGRSLGQDVFDPPNVKGWPGGTSWIDTTTLLNRRQLLERMTRGRDGVRARQAAFGEGAMSGEDVMKGGGDAMAAPEPRRRERRGGRSPLRRGADLTALEGLSRDRLIALLLPTAPTEPIDDDLRGRALISAIVLDPAYQLK